MAAELFKGQGQQQLWQGHLPRLDVQGVQQPGALLGPHHVAGKQGHAVARDHPIAHCGQAAHFGAPGQHPGAGQQGLAEKGIRVNGVAPGPIWTPLIPASFDAEQVAEFGQNVPMKRPGQPAELGPAYVYLACDDSSYMTGQVLHIGGGEIVGG